MPKPIRAEVNIPQYAVACAGIGMLDFRLKSDNVALYKIVKRFYLTLAQQDILLLQSATLWQAYFGIGNFKK